MKTKLIEIGLPGNVADEIVDSFDTYQRALKRHSRPKGKMEFQNRLQEIEQESKLLERKLSKLTLMEIQFVNPGCNPKIHALRGGLKSLALSCRKAQTMKSTFSKRSPFRLDLTLTLWGILERHGVAVTKYKNSILCKVLNILFPESENPREHRIDESEAPDDLWAFHLLREASKRKS